MKLSLHQHPLELLKEPLKYRYIQVNSRVTNSDKVSSNTNYKRIYSQRRQSGASHRGQRYAENHSPTPVFHIQRLACSKGLPPLHGPWVKRKGYD
jgi:hypothetical protein